MNKMIKVLILSLTMSCWITLALADEYKHDIKAIKDECLKKITLIQHELEKGEQEQVQDEQPKKIIAIFAQAERLYQQGQLQQAQALYEKVYRLSTDPLMESYVKALKKDQAKEKRRLIMALRAKKRLKANKLWKIRKLKRELSAGR